MSLLDEISNKAKWSGTIRINADNGAVDLSETLDEIWIALVDTSRNCDVLSGTLSGGEVVAKDAAQGFYEFSFPASRTSHLRERRYTFAGVAQISGERFQLFRQDVNAYEGYAG